MNDAIIRAFLLLFVFVLNSNVSLATKITECLCLNREQFKEFYFKIELICDNSVHDTDPQYYTCYHEIFMEGRGWGRAHLTTGQWCRGSTLDPRISNAFKNLEFYNISNHGIESLSSNDLRFDELRKLLASNNKLKSIAAGLFVHASKLVEIDFTYNRITALEEGSFLELNKLEHLRLTNNPIRHIDGKVFLPLNFRVYGLSITWSNVRRFDISDMNGMFDFGFSSFIYRGFTFGKNRDNDSNHTYLTVHYQSNQFEHLEYFNASNSAINDIVNVIEILGPQIKVIDVSSNHIGQINSSIFDRFENLIYLNLRNTNLTSFDFNDFNNRATIKLLDLSYNQLDRINFTPYAGDFKNLVALNMIGNELNEIDFVAQWNFPKLTAIGISENQFTCKYLQEFLYIWPDLEWFNTDNDPANQPNVRGINCHN